MIPTIDVRWCDPAFLDELTEWDDLAVDGIVARSAGVAPLPAQGYLNRSLVVATEPPRVVRLRRSGPAAAVIAYWTGLVGDDLARHLAFRCLSPEAEAARLAAWAAAGVPSPKVVTTGARWTAHLYVEGTALDTVDPGRRIQACGVALGNLRRLHAVGLTAMDRGHGNEILTPDGSVVFIDAELECAGPIEIARCVDLATALRGWLRLATEPELAARGLRRAVQRSLATRLYGTVHLDSACRALESWYGRSESESAAHENRVSSALHALLCGGDADEAMGVR
ncbi:MAG: hypothetical protein ACFCVF_15650 [Kineosporiaceae bacterium]